MSELGDRIRRARGLAGMNQTAMATAVGVSRGAATQWEGGDTEPTPANLRKIAEVTTVSYEWLATGIGEPRDAAPTARRADTFRPVITPGSELVSRDEMLPIYAAAMGGSGHLIVTFDPVQRVKMPSILEGVMNAYGILITGESMEPEFRPGDMALINPHLQPMRDETHVFYDHPPDGEAEAMVKRLVGWTDEKWKLRQFNPALDFDEDKADWPTCHRVVGKYNRR